MWLPLIYLMNSLLIIFLILLSVALVICVLERSSKQHRPRREKTFLLGFQQVLNQSLRLNRLARNWNFSRSKCRYDSSKKQTRKLLMRLRGCAGWSAPLLLHITVDRFLQSRSNCYPWTPRKHGKYDNSDIIVICAVSSKHSQSVCRHTKSYSAGYNTTWSTKVNMVFIELYKPRVTRMNYIEGK